jgi:hypothetical protein
MVNVSQGALEGGAASDFMTVEVWAAKGLVTR